MDKPINNKRNRKNTTISKTAAGDSVSNHSAIGSNWRDVRKEIFTQDEIRESDKRVSLLIKRKKYE